MILIMVALAVLVLPLQWCIAIILAAIFHELCHYLAIRICKGRIMGVSVEAGGAIIQVVGLSNAQELFCALAGPVGGLLLLFAIRWIPRTAMCAVFQSAYNLLPMYPLDGGRALRCVMELFLPLECADKICLWVERICLALAVGLGFYGTVILKLGLMPLLFAGVIFVKITCKQHRH